MRSSIYKETQADINKLGAYQVAGGVAGAVVFIMNLTAIHTLNESNFFIFLLLLIPFAGSIFCGILCFKKHPYALRFSMINQVAQLISFSVWGTVFIYVAGVHCTISNDFNGSFHLSVSGGISTFILSFNNNSEPKLIGVNVIAVISIFWTFMLMKTVKAEKEFDEIESIGRKSKREQEDIL